MNEPGATGISRTPLELVNSDFNRGLVELNDRWRIQSLVPFAVRSAGRAFAKAADVALRRRLTRQPSILDILSVIASGRHERQRCVPVEHFGGAGQRRADAAS